VVTYARELGRPVDRVADEHGRRIDVPVIDMRSVARAAVALHERER
jgi:hypothetical protein